MKQRTDPRLTTAFCYRIAQILGMGGSVHDGEALNAIRLANRLVREAQLTWPDLLCERLPAPDPEPEQWAYGDEEDHRPSGDLFFAWPLRWQAAVRFADRCRKELPDRERDFIDQLAIRNSGATPSEKQTLWLRGIVTRLIQRGFVP